MWMGWDGMGGRSRPIPPGRCPYLNCRRDTGLSHSPPKPKSPSIHPDGYRKEGTWAGKLGQEAQSARKAGARSASFCKRHGGLSSVCGPWARLRTSLSSCTPRAKNLPQVSVVDRCGWDPALPRTRYTSCTGHSDLFFPARTAPSHIKSLQRPLIAHTSAVGHHQHLLKGT